MITKLVETRHFFFWYRDRPHSFDHTGKLWTTEFQPQLISHVAEEHWLVAQVIPFWKWCEISGRVTQQPGKVANGRCGAGNLLFSEIQFPDLCSRLSHSHFPRQPLAKSSQHRWSRSPLLSLSLCGNGWNYFYHCSYTPVHRILVINLFLLIRATTQHSSNKKQILHE